MTENVTQFVARFFIRAYYVLEPHYIRFYGSKVVVIFVYVTRLYSKQGRG